MEVAYTYETFTRGDGAKNRFRELLRKSILACGSVAKVIDQGDWIKMPYYHHVFDDERKHFERQMIYLKNFGDFISIDDVWRLVGSGSPLKGRFFCLSFDDGFYSCYSNMAPITQRLDIPVVIYLPTAYIDLDVSEKADAEKIEKFYPEKNSLIPFLNWSQCKEMINAKISFGSHTVSHVNLMNLSPEDIEQELLQSKQLIEQKLGVVCEHFAAPWGRSGIDFRPEITTSIAQKLGYKTFATTNRGSVTAGSDLYLLKRDHMLASWENFQLKYFFGE